MPNYAIDVVKTPHHLSIDWGWFGPKVVGQYPPKFQVCILRLVKEFFFIVFGCSAKLLQRHPKKTFFEHFYNFL